MDKYTIIGLILTLTGTVLSTISAIMNKKKLKSVLIFTAIFLGIGIIFTTIGSVEDNKDLLLSNSSLEKANLELKLRLNEFEKEMEKILDSAGTIDQNKIRNLYTNYQTWSKSELDKEEKIQVANLRPKVKIELSENSISNLRVEITSLNKNSEKIENLFLKFDLPGVYDTISNIHKERVGEYKITPNFLCGSGNQTNAETIHISIKDLYTTGYLSFSIIYKPTRTRTQKSEFYEMSVFPLMDLHDISRYSIFWKYKGVTQKDDYYLDLSNLEFIKKDNQQLISQIIKIKVPLVEYLNDNGRLSDILNEYLKKGEKEFSFKIKDDPFPKSEEIVKVENDTIYMTKINNKPFRQYSTIEDVREMELNRKNW